MAMLLAGVLWAGLVGWLVRRAVRQAAAYRATSLACLLQGAMPEDLEEAEEVAIIVPARDEIANIADCLGCLTAQRGLGANSSIIVVDDGSQDGTGQAVAAAGLRDPRIELVDAGQLPAGWMGKPHACWCGATAAAARARARAPWLCFIDADVRAAPELVCAAIAAAKRHRIDMLSLNPFHLLGSFWERLVIPAGLVLIACTQDLRRIDDPDSPEISANGQFILVRREVYFAVNGHRAVRSAVAEDKALAAEVKRAGWRYRMLGAEDLMRTRMYTNLAALWEGFAKNATEIIGSGATTVAVATAAMVLAWSALLLPLLSGLIAFRQPASAASAVGFAGALLGSLAIVGVQLGAARHFRIPALFGLLFPCAYTAIAALAWHSVALRRTGRITWKGRTYQLDDRNA
jgi:chlorobactene glucosyltransferase